GLRTGISSSGGAAISFGRNRAKASDTSVGVWNRSWMDLAIIPPTTAGNPSGISGRMFRIGTGCRVWWAISFCEIVPSGNGGGPGGMEENNDPRTEILARTLHLAAFE